MDDAFSMQSRAPIASGASPGDDGVGDDVSVVVAVHGAGGEVTRAPVYEVAGEPRTQTAEVDPGGSGQASASLRDFVALP